MLYDIYASPSNWVDFQLDWAIDLLIADYVRHMESHQRTWNIDNYADDPEFAEELRREREAFREVIKFWEGNRSNTKLPTPEQLELFEVLSDVI